MNKEFENMLKEKFKQYVDTYRIDVTDIRDLVIEFQKYVQESVSEPLKDLIEEHADGKFAQTSVKYQTVESIKSTLEYLRQSKDIGNTKYLVNEIANELKAHTDTLIAIYSSVDNSQIKERAELKNAIYEFVDCAKLPELQSGSPELIKEDILDIFDIAYDYLDKENIQEDMLMVFNPAILKEPRMLLINSDGEELATWIEEAIKNIL